MMMMMIECRGDGEIKYCVRDDHEMKTESRRCRINERQTGIRSQLIRYVIKSIVLGGVCHKSI